MKKAMLIILDGFGEAPPGKGNAVAAAHMPFLADLKAKNPWTTLKTDGNASGLPEGQTGASEPGHITIGAGRIVRQPLEAINHAFRTGEILDNPDFKKFLKKAKSGKRVHLIGMLSDGGVHSHIDHLRELLKLLPKNNVFIHAIGDGRDVHEQSIAKYAKDFKLASLIGRYYAMDRDKNYDRTKIAYDLYTQKKGEKIAQIDAKMYKKDAKTDYFLPPFVLPDFQPITENDLILFFNFRSDRAEQITSAFSDPNFEKFDRSVKISENFFAFGPYTLGNAPNIFPPLTVKNNLGSWWAEHDVHQLRIAETEKFAHVTFFFNSQEKESYQNEERVLIPSPKCRSYDEQPEMSAGKVTEALLKELQKDKFEAIVLNFANPDLVGHSAVFEAAKQACEFIDTCLAQIVPLARAKGFSIIITADHGNSDEMLYPNGEVSAAHSLNPVPCVFLTDKKIELHEKGELQDLAPTLLDMQELPVPSEMTGRSFVTKEA